MNINRQDLDAQGMEKYFFRASADEFEKITGAPVTYWVTKKAGFAFINNPTIADVADTRMGMAAWCETNPVDWAHLNTMPSFQAFSDRFHAVANALLRPKSELPGLT